MKILLMLIAAGLLLAGAAFRIQLPISQPKTTQIEIL